MANGTTKAVNLTEDELKHLIFIHGGNLNDESRSDSIERINYLHRRLKSFNEPEKVGAMTEAQAAAPTTAAGW